MKDLPHTSPSPLLAVLWQRVWENRSLFDLTCFGHLVDRDPSSWDMYPKTEKMANPAKMLVMALPRVTMKVSLQRRKQML